jgi:phage recombination protein Bet
MSTEITKAAGSLAIRPDQTDWTPQQGAVLRQSGIDNQVTTEELSAFLHLCQRTRLDPFSRQIYLIGRWDNRQQRKVYTPQTSIDGYRVIAHRVVAEQGGHLGYEDTMWCDTSGRWRDVWLAEAPPAAVKVTVIRNGQRFPAVALFREYVQTGKENKPIGLWGKMPAGQLAKCAEALALRKAFPHDLAGVYTAEEMAQADNPAPERHLRSVQPGEPDQWSTPAPEMPATAAAPRPEAEPEANSAAQAIADQAATATHRGRARELWALAKSGRVLDAAMTASDTGVVEKLGDYLTRRAGELPEEPAADEPIDVEIVGDTPETQAAAAERALRAAAAKVGFPNVDEEFERSYGLPIAQAGATQLREMTALLTGSAA